MTAVDAGGPAKQQVDLPAEATNWLALIADCDAKIKDLEEIRKIARGHLERMLGDAEVGLVDGQPAVRWSFVSSRRFDQSKFKAAHPDLAREFMVEGVGRRFTLAGGDQ